MRISTIIKARRVNYLHYLSKLSHSDMLGKFFRCQWNSSRKHDWCHQVRKDLSDLNLPCELSTICCKSTLSWKALVKRQVNIFEFKELSNLMSNMSKLKELTYKELKMQNYMLEFDSKLAKLILRYRIRMSNYSGNFKGKGQVMKCPVCKLHDDHQHLAFQCNEIKSLVLINFQYSDIFANQISGEIGQGLKNIEQVREKINQVREREIK